MATDTTMILYIEIYYLNLIDTSKTLQMNGHKQMDSRLGEGHVAHWTTLRNIFSSHGMQSLESVVKSYNSWAWSSNDWKSGCFSNATLITYLFWHSPTYTTRCPFGTSLGTTFSSLREVQKDHSQHMPMDDAKGMSLRSILRHFLVHDFRNLHFVIFILCVCVVLSWESFGGKGRMSKWSFLRLLSLNKEKRFI